MTWKCSGSSQQWKAGQACAGARGTGREKDSGKELHDNRGARLAGFPRSRPFIKTYGRFSPADGMHETAFNPGHIKALAASLPDRKKGEEFRSLLTKYGD